MVLVAWCNHMQTGPTFFFFSLCLSLDLQGRISLSLTHSLSLSLSWRTHVSSPTCQWYLFRSVSFALSLSVSLSLSLSLTHAHTHTHTHSLSLSLDLHKRLLPRASDAEAHDILLDLLDDEDLTQQRRRGRAERFVFVPVWYVSCHELASRTTYTMNKTVWCRGEHRAFVSVQCISYHELVPRMTNIILYKIIDEVVLNASCLSLYNMSLVSRTKHIF